MQLYDYFRSSAAYRVRVALNLKGLSYQQVKVDLLQAEQRETIHRQRNAQGLVPVLEVDNQHLTQSLAICEYLDEIYPERFALLPQTPLERAKVRAMAQLIACDIHPVDNLRVLNYLQTQFGVGDKDKQVWYQHWIHEGFQALEQQLQARRVELAFCAADRPGLADLCLVPQVYNAQRFETDLSAYPQITAIAERCNQLQAFQQAHPDQQSS